MRERQIPSPASLTLANGKLNPDAVGWASSPIIDTSGIGSGRGRNKRWEYWNVVTPTHILAMTVSSIDYACVPEVWVYDRETGATWGRSDVVIPARGSQLAATLEEGPSYANAKGMRMRITELHGAETSGEGGARATRLEAQSGEVSFDVIAELPDGHERLALVVPWSDTRFQYTVKDVARPAHGTLIIGGKTFDVPSGESWAVLDHGRGRWPYNITWNWGAGSGRSNGRVIGIQVGAKWTDGTGVTENAFMIDGKMMKIHAPTRWEYDLTNWRTPWRITGGGLDATFTPFTLKQARMNFGILKGYTDQCFGIWSGTFTPDPEFHGVETAQTVIKFDGIVGWAEEVSNRW